MIGASGEVGNRKRVFYRDTRSWGFPSGGSEMMGKVKKEKKKKNFSEIWVQVIYKPIAGEDYVNSKGKQATVCGCPLQFFSLPPGNGIVPKIKPKMRFWAWSSKNRQKQLKLQTSGQHGTVGHLCQLLIEIALPWHALHKFVSNPIGRRVISYDHITLQTWLLMLYCLSQPYHFSIPCYSGLYPWLPLEIWCRGAMVLL